MIRSIHRSSQGQVTSELPLAEWRSALQDGGGLLWVDFAAEPDEQVRSALADIFGFHPLTIQSVLDQSNSPRLADVGQHLYAVMHSIAAEQAASGDPPPRTASVLVGLAPDQLATQEIDIFLGPNFLVTYHQSLEPTPAGVWELVQAQPDSLAHGPAFLLYYLVDAVVATYKPLLYRIDDTIDDLEGQIFEDQTHAPRITCLTLKRVLLEVRQLIRPQREALWQLSREPLTFVSDTERVYFRDAYDDLMHVTDLLNTLMDRLDSVLGVYLSVVSNRTNDVMKVLTVYTALFLPISFLASFFGVNFP